VALVSGIGCTGRMPVYLDFNTMHTTHGRALAFATGLKLARPELKVIVIMGDGDALAIGGNHFIHAARRNIDLTAIVVNNSIYGMTGGQYSPPRRWMPRHHGPLRQHRAALPDLRPGHGRRGLLCGPQHRLSRHSSWTADRAGHRKEGLQPGRGGQLLPHHLWAGQQTRQRRGYDARAQREQHHQNAYRKAEPRRRTRHGKIVRGVLCDLEKPEYTEMYNLLERAQAVPARRSPRRRQHDEEALMDDRIEIRLAG
jgi:2-oxoglutarate/2-oxoacid ferredoxin oxidoreductase subunit beta